MKVHFMNGTKLMRRLAVRVFLDKSLIFALNVIYVSNRIEENCISGKVCIKYILRTPLKFLLPPIKIRKYQESIAWREKKLNCLLLHCKKWTRWNYRQTWKFKKYFIVLAVFFAQEEWSIVHFFNLAYDNEFYFIFESIRAWN